MDLTVAGVSAYQQSLTLGQVATTVDAKVLNIAREQGQAALQLLQSATQGISGGDPQTAAATGRGGSLDVRA